MIRLYTFAGSKQEGLDLDTPSAAETRVASGEPVGDPSGATPSLTPSNAQIAEARSLAGGKVVRLLLSAERKSNATLSLVFKFERAILAREDLMGLIVMVWLYLSNLESTKPLGRVWMPKSYHSILLLRACKLSHVCIGIYCIRLQYHTGLRKCPP